MGIISSDGAFASFRHKIHAHHNHNSHNTNRLHKNTNAHRRNASNNSSSLSTSSGTTAATSIDSTSGASNHLLDPGMIEQQKRRYKQEKTEAKEIWSKKQRLIRNDWTWVNASKSRTATDSDNDDGGPQIDTAKNYVERSLSTAEDIGLDIAAANGLKHKREARSALLEEATWNRGLSLFEQRRKAWTGAVDVFLPEGKVTDHAAVDNLLQNPRQMLSEIQTQQDRKREMEVSLDDMAFDSCNFDATTNPWGTTLLPLYVPTLPDTFSLTQPLPSVAAERVLYKNLVVDVKTAVAPIPLANVIKACVTGLQEAEAWPPKAGPMDPLAGKVNKDKRRSKLKSLLRIHKDNDTDENTEIMKEPGALAGEAAFEASS